MNIESFTGDHRFLSNFWPVVVKLDGGEYRSVEHAYQAAKTLDLKNRRKIRNLPTAAGAKQLGKKIKIRPYWDIIKVDVMLGLLRQKFAKGSPLADKLLATDQSHLEEENYWGDTYWGVCKGVGKNKLGRLLMFVRDELRP